MKYRAVAFDIDGTITMNANSWQYLHEILGRWDGFACRYQELFTAGRISYREFCELDAAVWKGIKEKLVEELFQKVPYAPNAGVCAGKLREAGFMLVSVSTGLQYIPGRLVSELGFDRVISNRLLSRGGILTGAVEINVAHGGKGTALSGILSGTGIRPEEVISVGDSEGDMEMFEASGYSIAFNPASRELSRSADYNCRTLDLMEVYEAVMEASGPAP